jgi:flagellar assembly factor FliW
MSSSAAIAYSPGMIIPSDLLGPLTVSEEEVVQFPAGLYGFPECQRFVVVPAEREGLYWLQSLDHAALAFLLADPFAFFDGYSVDLAPTDLAELQATESSEIGLLAIVTLPRTRHERPTANLQGPLAIHLGAQRGKQLAIAESEFGVRCAFEL